MKKDNFAVIEALKILSRQIGRLREGFRIEKEEALSEEGEMTLEELRERARTHYRLELAGISRQVQRLRSRIDSELPAMEEAQDLAETCRRDAEELSAHLVATPSRLIRSATVADHSGEAEA